MRQFTVSQNDLTEIINILSKHNLKGWVDYVKRYSYHSKTLNDLNFLTNKNILKNEKLLEDFYLYTQDKDCNILEFFDEKLQFQYATGALIFLSYTRLIKSGTYKPDDAKIYSLIQKQNAYNNQVFWAMFSLASLIKDNNISTKAFYLILKEKKSKLFSFTLLDLEKAKRSWDKRFKAIDTKLLPNKEYTFIYNLFNEINECKKKALCSSKSGSYLNIFVDINLISQETKLSKNKNHYALSSFFNAFAEFIDKSNDGKSLLTIDEVTITEAEPKTMSFNVILYYNDPSKTELIKKIMGELVDYAIVKDKDGTLQATKDEHNNKFFSSFIMNYNLQTSLDKKEEVKVKKEKL